MDDATKQKAALEISKIDNLVEKSSVLLSKCKIAEPDFVELNAIGSILHSYYGGIESVFNLIYKSIYNKTLSGNMWHSDLFTDMFEKTDFHEPILPEELFKSLREYLGFRHVFRHSYGYELDWKRMQPLFFALPENWAAVKNALNKFFNIS